MTRAGTMTQEPVPVLKDDDHEHPVPSAWRPTLRAIVAAFVRGDFALATPVPDVDPVDEAVAAQIRNYIADYGETLVELSDDTWSSSVCQWMGSYWDVLVDLWTEGEGRSDLVLHAEVFEQGDGVRFRVYLVYVP